MIPLKTLQKMKAKMIQTKLHLINLLENFQIMILQK